MNRGKIIVESTLSTQSANCSSCSIKAEWRSQRTSRKRQKLKSLEGFVGCGWGNRRKQDITSLRWEGSELSSHPPSLSSWKPLQTFDLKELPAAGTAQREVPETDMSEVFCQGARMLSLRKTLIFLLLFMHVVITWHTHMHTILQEPGLGLEKVPGQVNFRCATLHVGH